MDMHVETVGSQHMHGVFLNCALFIAGVRDASNVKGNWLPLVMKGLSQ